MEPNWDIANLMENEMILPYQDQTAIATTAAPSLSARAWRGSNPSHHVTECLKTSTSCTGKRLPDLQLLGMRRL